MGKKAMELLPVAMLSFEEFKKEVLENIREKLPEGDYEIRTQKMETPTRSYEGLVIFDPGKNLAPAINLSEIYSYSAAVGANLGEAMDSIVDTYKFARRPFIDLDINKLLDYESVKEKVTVRLLNGERENAGLANSAHKELGSFEAAYYISVGEGESAITNKRLEKYGVSVDDLHEQAVKNVARVNGASLHDISEIVSPEYLFGGTLGDGCLNKDEPLEPGTMYTLTNHGGYGAALILDTDLMDKIADRCGGKMYVIPSSVHEVIIVPDNGAIDPEELDSVIQTINRNEVKPEEVLGERSMIYEKETHSLYYASEYAQGQKIEALKDRSPDFQRMQSLGPELIQ